MNWKKIFSTWLLMLPFSASLASENTAVPEQWFKEGNSLYAKGLFPESSSSYRKAVDAGFYSFELYYNLGNAYFKQGDVAFSLLYFEKALAINPTDEDLLYNIKLAGAKATDKIDSYYPDDLEQIANKVLYLVRGATLNLLWMCLFSAGCFLLLLFLLVNPKSFKKLFFLIGVGLAFLGLLGFSLYSWQEGIRSRHDKAILFGDQITVRSSPESASKALVVLHAGAKVELVSVSGLWALIQVKPGTRGWVERTHCKAI